MVTEQQPPEAPTAEQPLPAGEPRRPRVVVVFGGRSGEHGVSCVTAGSVLQALDAEAYDVVAVGIAQDGRWVLESSDPDRLRLGADGAFPQVDGSGPEAQLLPTGHGAELVVRRPDEPAENLGRIDVVLPLLHGPWGEDGTLQGMLEMANVRYVGAGVLASAMGMDKHFMKVALQASGLAVLPHVLVTGRGWDSDAEACRERVRALGYPVFVKPARGGSSLGISKVREESELDAAIREAREHDPRVLVESFAGADAREIECGVIEGEDGSPQASVVAEIVVGGGHDFYDLAAKYLPEEGTRLDVPADLPDAVADQLRATAARAFEALGCEGLARVDFFLLHDGRAVINEINTMPGFTPTSMFPRMWAQAGVSYVELVDRLLRAALRRDTGLR